MENGSKLLTGFAIKYISKTILEKLGFQIG
jgi:hypothetical protein